MSSLPAGVSVEIAGGIGPAGPQRAAPGLVTVPIVTTGLPLGFVATTAQLNPGVACVWDLVEYGPTQENFEMAPITVPDSTHIAITLAKIHYGPWAISQGGGCGWGLGQEADRRKMGGNTDIVNVTPILAGIDAHTVRIDFHANSFGIVGSGGFFSANCGIVSITSNGTLATVVLVTDNTKRCENLGGMTATFAGNVQDLMGSHVLTSTGLGGTQYTFPVSTGTTESGGAGGSVTVNNGAYTLYPIAEVLGVLNPFDNLVDGGQFTLAPNIMPLATGDVLLQPPFWSQSFMQAEETRMAEAVPGYDATSYNGGCVYADLAGSIVSRGQTCYRIQNNIADNLVLGLGQGGTHAPLNVGYVAQGAMYTVLDGEFFPGGNGVVFRPLHDANQYDLPFAPMTFDTHQAAKLWYSPQAGTVDFQNVVPTVKGAAITLGSALSGAQILTLAAGSTQPASGSYSVCPLVVSAVNMSTAAAVKPTVTLSNRTCTYGAASAAGTADQINLLLAGGSS